MLSRRGRSIRRLVIALIAFAIGMTLCAPSAIAVAVAGGAVPAVRMFGYAKGPVQEDGTAAGRPHYVAASATRSSLKVPGHAAPVPGLAPPAMAAPRHVTVGAVRTDPGHVVTRGGVRGGTSQAAAPAASAAAAALADDASYSVAPGYDTPPMADQTGRVAVTLTNTGTGTWSGGYGLEADVYASSDTAGTGTPLTRGQDVVFGTTVAPGAPVTVEGVTPNEKPGSYEVCWDAVTPSGVTFASADGGASYCAGYTVEQYAAQVDEQSPLPGTSEDTQTPQLSASATVPGGYPADPSFSFAFEVLAAGASAGTYTVEQSSGWVAGNGNSWTVPKALTWGSTYYWEVAVSDAASPPSLSSTAVTWTAPVSFVVGSAQAGVGSRLGPVVQADDGNPVMTSDLGDGTSDTGSGKTVDPKTANVTQQVTDASVATAGPSLSVVRTYNSLDPRTSQAFGAGWSSAADMSLAPDPDGTGALVLTLADGQQARFAKNASGGYAPPQDLYAAVKALSGGGFSVTDQTGTTYDFAQESGADWLISGISDDQGQTETFSYASGELTTITSNVSGRALHFTWSVPSGASYAHVASVSTDPVTAGDASTALTWTYGYSGDLLASVCAPGTTTACTKYSYITDGSHAATAVLNADPSAYFRLDDAAGTAAAANEVPVDDLTTVDPPATEMNTALGVAGPGDGATATGFNGTSSWIPADDIWCTTASADSSCSLAAGSDRVVTSSTTSLGFSVWFKTTTASGVLLGETESLPGTCGTGCSATGATPVLWITSAGDLEGAGALTSAAAVDDGKWHQAVLIPGKVLYVDGVKVASGAGSFATPPGSYVELGTGIVASGSTGKWEYFDGSMADFAVYQDELPGAGTVAAQYAAETTPAAELSGVTSPGGRTEMTATYDTVNDRVASLTDAHGGTWDYSGPVDQSSSAGYDDAVLASGPEDFWPLNDTAGPQARDMVAGAADAADPRPAAAYADVTLGEPGPTGFADGTAAGFGGSDSEITVPGGYFSAAGGAGESAELWFSAAKAGTLLSAGSGTGGNPPALWVNSSGCVEGQIDGIVLDPASCGSVVGDGKWHQVAFTLSAVETNAAGTASQQAAALYVDGKVTAANDITPPVPSAAGYTAIVGDGSHGDFGGSIADVSLYGGALTATDVTAHYGALANQVKVPAAGSNPADPTYLATPAVNTQTITVTSPSGKNAAYVYAGGNLARETDVLGGTTYYGYDASNRAATVTDPDGDTTYTTHDAYNNVTSTTTCAEINDCQTSYTSYYEDLSNPLDPRNNKPADDRDARSSSPTDPAYDTVTAYTAQAQVASKTTPPTTACPAGCKTAYAYTAGTEAAAGGGTEPAGLLKTVTSPGGGVTSYEYDSAGDVAQVTNPLGLVTRYAYDNLGRQLSQTQVSDTYPAGLTTSYAYDGQDQVVTETDPPVTDRVTGAVHTEVTRHTYDPDGDVLTTTVSDATGGDASRTTVNTYDAHGNLASVTDPLGNKTAYTYDALGDRVSQTSAAGVTTSYGYDAAGNLLTTTLVGYTGNPSDPIAAENLVQDSRSYDPAGHLASDTNVAGTTTDYTYYGNGQVASSYVAASSGEEDVHTYAYDAAGNEVSDTAPGGLVTDTAYNADNQVTSQTVDPAGTDRVTTAAYDPDGNVVGQALSGGGVTQTTTSTYNAMDEELSQTVGNTGGNLTTTYVRDERGLVISETDPDHDTTTYENDEAGRTVVTTSPAVAAQAGNGAAAVTANPVTTVGYDTFGDQTESEDADGNITAYAYDGDGQQVSVTSPSYTPPGSGTPVNPTSTTAYDSMGQVISETDPLGNTTTYGYDQLGDQASETGPGTGETTYTYDPAGEQTSVTGPTGAQTQATYNSLGEMVTTTDLVRQDTSAADTTTYGYDGAGNQVSQTSPAGVVTKAAYNAVGEETSSTDGAGNTTGYAYNLDGDLVKTTLPDGTATTAAYDLAGRETGQADLGASGNTIRSESAAYTPDGQVATATDYRGDTTTYHYDAMGDLTSEVQPVSSAQSITVSYGYDLDGNQTALTDGNGHTTYSTYNPLGLPAVITEPSTAAYTSAADTQTTDIYDADGDLVTQDQPGGVQVNDAYDAMGDLTSQSGTGATAATATRTFTYDDAGRMLTAATSAAGTQGAPGYQPATSETFSYDDRGLLLSSSGSAGTSAYTYNAAGQMTADTDAAGTSAYTYDSAGRLATDAGAASGATGTYGYNDLDQVTSISYGTGNDSQSFGYDDLHRLTSDTLTGAAGATVASLGYGYNDNDDVTSVTTSGLAGTGGSTGTVTNTYAYDEAGRLTSWTAAPAGGTATVAAYTYDNDGNMTSDNGVTYTYDARDELVSGSNGDTYTYSADGDMTGQASGTGTTTSTSDAYGQQITSGTTGGTSAGASTYTWDALDRVVAAAEPGGASVNLTYEGLTNEVASDSSAAYSRDPSGGLTGVDSSAGGRALALNDQHDDLSGLFTASGTSLSGSTTYNPWGQVLGASGVTVQVGYQGQWTDPATGQVNMGSRFYQPATGSFTGKDTAPASGGAAVTDDAYAYGDDNPVTVTDPTGHSPSGSSGAGDITAADVAGAWARAGEARARAEAASGAAAAARTAAAGAEAAASTAAAVARGLNDAAEKARELAAQTAKLAAAAFRAAAAEMQQVASWQARADDAWEQAREDGAKALSDENPANIFNGGYHPIEGAELGYDALKETAIAGYDEIRAGAAFVTWLGEEMTAFTLSFASDIDSALATMATDAAKGAAEASVLAGHAAAAAESTAQYLAGVAAEEARTASWYEADANSLAGAYAAQVARALAAARAAAERAARAAAARVARAAKKAATVVKKAAVTVAKAAYKYSGAQSVVSCATDPTLSSCVQAAVAVAGAALTVATGGAGAAVDVGLDAAVDATTDVAVDAAEDTTEDAVESCLVGGSSFTAKTKVLLANGTAVPISSLKLGEKVLATNTKTGKTEAEAVTAVMLHYDTDLYDLKVRAKGKTMVIDTTSSHLFWVPGSGGHAGQWVKAGALKYGTRLRTAEGRGTAAALGGMVPRQQDGWMWDITVPGDDDHDFYVQTASTDVLVHNCGNVSSTVSAAKGVLKGAFSLRQLGIGAAGGAVGNGIDAYEDGERGGKFWGTVGLGAVTGAMSNINLGNGFGPSMLMGGLSGDINGAGSQLISNGGNISKVNMGWVAVDTGLGALENAAGTGIQGDDENPTLGNSMSAVAGLWPSALCGGLDNSHNWDC
jgi:RHS repeat-associated protein